MILLLTSSRETVAATIKALADVGFAASVTRRGKTSMISVVCEPADCDKVLQVAKAIDPDLEHAR